MRLMEDERLKQGHVSTVPEPTNVYAVIVSAVLPRFVPAHVPGDGGCARTLYAVSALAGATIVVTASVLQTAFRRGGAHRALLRAPRPCDQASLAASDRGRLNRDRIRASTARVVGANCGG